MNKVICGDSAEVLKQFEYNTFHSMVTDPPAGIAFMGKEWDKDKGGRDAWIEWLTEIMREAHRVLKPGAHILVWALPRTSHWTATAVEDAGFEVRDIVSHIFGNGFPKSMNVGKAIDKKLGAKREVIGVDYSGKILRANGQNERPYQQGKERIEHNITAPATDEAKQWDGWGTTLKPSTEFWILARKPIEGTVADNVLKYGVGGLNIDECRVELADGDDTSRKLSHQQGWKQTSPLGSGSITDDWKKGRWPANLILSHSEECGETCVEGCPIKLLDEQSGVTKSVSGGIRKGNRNLKSGWNMHKRGDIPRTGHYDSGGASRFFKTFNPESEGSQFMYCAKASKKDRGEFNNHPTVKNTKLMEYLIRLVTPPNGVVLDPFAGSGSTLVAAKRGGWGYVGIEMDEQNVGIINKRLEEDANLFNFNKE